MRRFQRVRDTGAFQQLVSHYAGPALGVAQKILCDRVLAEDAVQETFLRVVRCRDRYDASKPFSLWFYTILRNICRDMLRQRRRHMKAMGEIAKGAIRATENPGHSLDVQDVLQSLPASEQIVLTLRIVHDLPFRDIAAVVGITVEAARKRAQRGLKTLRQKMYPAEIRGGKAGAGTLIGNVSKHSKPASPSARAERI
jgi:RNA polymerase sigma-70 factor, ECF subfamily